MYKERLHRVLPLIGVGLVALGVCAASLAQAEASKTNRLYLPLAGRAIAGKNVSFMASSPEQLRQVVATAGIFEDREVTIEITMNEDYTLPCDTRVWRNSDTTDDTAPVNVCLHLEGKGNNYTLIGNPNAHMNFPASADVGILASTGNVTLENVSIDYGMGQPQTDIAPGVADASRAIIERDSEYPGDVVYKGTAPFLIDTTTADVYDIKDATSGIRNNEGGVTVANATIYVPHDDVRAQKIRVSDSHLIKPPNTSGAAVAVDSPQDPVAIEVTNSTIDEAGKTIIGWWDKGECSVDGTRVVFRNTDINMALGPFVAYWPIEDDCNAAPHFEFTNTNIGAIAGKNNGPNKLFEVGKNGDAKGATALFNGGSVMLNGTYDWYNNTILRGIHISTIPPENITAEGTEFYARTYYSYVPFHWGDKDYYIDGREPDLFNQLKKRGFLPTIGLLQPED